ncbi:MAG: tripartite tricarboxylate transporter TctB family protein [Gracilibacteraceae bacterium]|jgi:hypothetical protein|nr:tripartite tricarboxylate transporter TctB family protein [Gracilibacteraceae bacterium]
MFKDKKSLMKAEIVFGGILILVSAFFLVESIKIINEGHKLRTTNAREAFLTSPGLMPLFLTTMLIIMGVVLIIGSAKEVGGLNKEDFQTFKNWLKSIETKRSFIMFGFIIAYTFIFLGRMPYEVSTFIFLTVFMFYLKASDWKRILIISTLATGIIAYAFGTLAMIPLP